MNALITITHRTVEHNNPAAAGFTDGWWWTATTPLGYFESATADLNDSKLTARQLAERHGANEIAEFVGLDLLPREKDEARVADAIDAWTAANETSEA